MVEAEVKGILSLAKTQRQGRVIRIYFTKSDSLLTETIEIGIVMF